MIRIGIVGTGDIAHVHAKHLAAMEGVRIAGAYDVVGPKAARFAQAYDAKAYPSAEALLAEVDAVYVCTPPQFHRQVIVLATEAGVNVFTEKPLTVSVADALAVQTAVQKSKISFMVGFPFRFEPEFQQLKRLFASGELGEALSFYCLRVLWLPHLPPNWRTDPRFIVGMTIESMSHDFDLMRWIVGDAVSVAGAMVSTSRPDLDGYDNVLTAGLRLACGAQASFHSSWASHIRFGHHGVHGIIGTRGSAVTDNRALRYQMQTQTREQIISAQPDSQPHLREDEHFIQCLKTGAAPMAGVRDGVATVQISHAILQAARQTPHVPI